MDSVVLERVATAAPFRRRLKLTRKRLMLTGLALAVAIGLIGYGDYWWTTGRFIESTDDAYAGGNVTPVSPHVAGFVARDPGRGQSAGPRRAIADPPRPARFPSRPRSRPGDCRPSGRRRFPRSKQNACCNRRRSIRPKPISGPGLRGRRLPEKTPCATAIWRSRVTARRRTPSGRQRRRPRRNPRPRRRTPGSRRRANN